MCQLPRGLSARAAPGGKWLGELPEGVANAMLAVVIVHIAAVVLGSLAHRENLAAGMLTGRKRGAPGAGIGQPQRFVAAALIIVVVGLWMRLVPTPGLELQQTLISITSPAHAGVHAGHHDD